MEAIETKVIELTKAIFRLYFNDIDASNAISKLKEEDIGDVTDEFVQRIYDLLIKESRESVTIEDIKDRFLKLIRSVCEMHRYDETDVSAAIQILQKQGFKEISVELVETLYNHLERQSENQLKFSFDGAEKARYYSLPLDDENLETFVGHVTDENFHDLELFDCYNNKSIKISVQKNAPILTRIYPLLDNFGIFIECRDDFFFVSLVIFDFYTLTFKNVETIQCSASNLWIGLNYSDLTKFVLQLSINGEKFARICKVVENEILVGNAIKMPYVCTHFNGRLFGLERHSTYSGLIRKCEVFVHCIEDRTSNKFDLDFPEGYYGRKGHFYFRLIADKAFFPLQFAHGGFVISCLDIETHQWTIMQFATKMYPQVMIVSNANDLIFSANKSRKDERGLIKYEIGFYKFSLRKPDLLENMAWIALVKTIKKSGTSKDPYESARYYLPPNSAIRCPFVEYRTDKKMESLME